MRLSVNLNKIALVRNARDGGQPDLGEFARRCLEAGAHGITVHPRPDQRHVRARDVRTLRRLLGETELNVEGNPFAGPAPAEREGIGDYPGFMSLVSETCPVQCTLVPDATDQLTSDHGFDLEKDGARLEPLIKTLRDAGIRVSLFMDPEPGQVARAAVLGAQRIELYTGPYAQAYAHGQAPEAILEPYQRAAEAAAQAGLGVNAGHDLDLNNLGIFVAAIPRLLEVSIGHALTVDALRLGMENAVRAYLALLPGAGDDS